MKGEQAFFYHSNCKVPGIIGVMEIVEEHTTDGKSIRLHLRTMQAHMFPEAAHDPNGAFYDPKSSPSSPKWSVVQVAFRRKFPQIVALKELQKHAKRGNILAGMQTLRQPRLSVTKVSKEQWDFIMGLVDGGEH